MTMDESSVVRTDDPERLRREIRETRMRLVKDLHDLEQHVEKRIRETTEKVTGRVSATTEKITGTIDQSVDRLRKAADVPGHVQRSPLAAVGAATLAGVAVGAIGARGAKKKRQLGFERQSRLHEEQLSGMGDMRSGFKTLAVSAALALAKEGIRLMVSRKR